MSHIYRERKYWMIIKQWFLLLRERRAIKNIRKEFLLLGFDTTALTDKDIKDGLVKVSKFMSRSAGCSATDAAIALRRIGKVSMAYGKEDCGIYGTVFNKRQ